MNNQLLRRKGKTIAPFRKGRKFTHRRVRAYIVRLSTVNDLIELILRLKLPNEKQAEVKGNHEYRVIAKSELHACRKMLDLKVRPDAIEEIYQLNP